MSYFKNYRFILPFLILSGVFYLPALMPPAQAQSQAPAFTAHDIYDMEHSLSDYSGKPLVLYFWATWCPGCRRDTENILEVYKDFHPKGIEFVSVSLDKDLNRLKSYVDEFNIQFPVLFDGKGWENEVAVTYGIRGTPAYLIISGDGEILAGGNWSSDLREDLQLFTSHSLTG